jgi:hypothetical protein
MVPVSSRRRSETVILCQLPRSGYSVCARAAEVETYEYSFHDPILLSASILSILLLLKFPDLSLPTTGTLGATYNMCDNTKVSKPIQRDGINAFLKLWGDLRIRRRRNKSYGRVLEGARIETRIEGSQAKKSTGYSCALRREQEWK